MPEEAGLAQVNTVVVVSDGADHRAAVLAAVDPHQVEVLFCRGGVRSYIPRRRPFLCVLPTQDSLTRLAPIAVHPALLGEAVRAFLSAGCPNVVVTADQRGEYQLHHAADWM